MSFLRRLFQRAPDSEPQFIEKKVLPKDLLRMGKADNVKMIDVALKHWNDLTFSALIFLFKEILIELRELIIELRERTNHESRSDSPDFATEEQHHGSDIHEA